jgi:ferredoxin
MHHHITLMHVALRGVARYGALVLLLVSTVRSWLLESRIITAKTAWMKLKRLQLKSMHGHCNEALKQLSGGWAEDDQAPKHIVTIISRDGYQKFSLEVPENRYIFACFEDQGVELPIANKDKMCRQGCCTTCAARVLSGDVRMGGALGLTTDLKDNGYALICSACPASDVVLQLQDEDEVYKQQWGDSFESGGITWGGFLPDHD